MRAAEKISPLIDSVASKAGKGRAPKLLEPFSRLLYGRGVPEDLEAYSADALAELAREAFGFLKERKPGRHKLRLYNPEDGAPGGLGEITVIEIANDDMPFLVDSTLGLLSERGHDIALVLHPILAVERSPKGELTGLDDGAAVVSDHFSRESFIHIHISRLGLESDRASLEADIDSMLKDVRTVVLDWPGMRDRLDRAVTDYQANPPAVAVEELSESIQFLQWLLDNHFTFLGMREYAFEGGPGHGQLKAVRGSGLGILRDPKVQVLRRGRELVEITPEVREFLNEPAPLIITKANVRATVHRRSHMDYIGIKQFSDDGQLMGELRLVGLFTSAAYTRSPRYIPMLRRKVGHVMASSGFKPDGHSGKALQNVLETFPRDELFQIDTETLTDTALGILQLEERPRTRMFVRRDKFDRFVSALVYVPRDRYTTDVRRRIGDLLASAYDGRVSAFFPAFPEGSLVRVHYILGRYEGETPSPDVAELEAQATEIVRTWDDRLTEAVQTECAPELADSFIGRYRGAFSAAYQEAFPPSQAVADILQMERLSDDGDIAVELHPGDEEDGDAAVNLKLYHLGEPIALSDRLPILENMGFRSIDERTYRITRAGADGAAEPVVLHEVTLKPLDGEPIDLDAVGGLVNDGFAAVWTRQAESDGYNTLLPREGLAWREAALLRACSKYLRQAAVPYSGDYMAATLTKYPDLARKLLELFEARFDPAFPKAKGADAGRDAAMKAILDRIDEVLASVPSLDEDRIVRRFANLVMAMTRTNYYQRDAEGGLRPTISFKIDSRKVDGLPDPKPFAEIFVYAPDVEGVHLRGGKIARGGLRWSDRPEDFRTEVLGLAKAQNVKNAVIVPVGAKGGFVAKRLPQGGTREEILAEGVRCYKLFVSSMLDITDNLDGDTVVRPEDVVRHDGDDPYLVVAADKGTATFSDIANEISTAHDFWLDDAFASGGSAGYDHKKMGITARGAWEAVKRHFREMDIDIQTTPFTVLGVGDMSGDVFGNGMLLSKATKLVAAFDHRDIFIDPDPDPVLSWQERQRLFELPRSSWQDYSHDLISEGGGVFSRQAKSVPLSAQIRALTGLKGASASPNEVIRALLKAKVDLIWFGGIGTYIRGDEETDADVGDRANDAIRIAASELGAKVIGEGANLGLTQRARVAFGLKGGRVNSDAVDNSAGVNSSDIEVNIKIALGAAEAAGTLKRPARNKLLAAMTEEVGDLVLRNNYLQTLCLSLSEKRALEELGFHERLMRALERKGLLDRELEFLPNDRTLKARAAQGTGLTRPELAVLMAYAKIVLFDQLVASGVPDDPYLARELRRYFPARLDKRHGGEIEGHRLRREIISTMLANSMINRGGPAFVSRLQDETGVGVAPIAAAYAVARDSFGFTELNALVDGLDNRVPSGLQTDLYLELQALLRSQTLWFLRNASLEGGLDRVVRHYRQGLAALHKALPDVLPEESGAGWSSRIATLQEAGMEAEEARRLAGLSYLSRGPDIVLVAGQAKRPVEEVARGFFALGDRLMIDRIAASAAAMEVTDYYDRLAINRTMDGILATHRTLVAEMIAEAKSKEDAWQMWSDAHSGAIGRTCEAVSELLSGGTMTLARLAVASSQLQDLSAELAK